MLGEEVGLELVNHTIEPSTNFFNTASMYSGGESERALEKAPEGCRDEAIVASRIYFQAGGDDPNPDGLSRKAIKRELDSSLGRLGIDVLDLLQIRRYNYDTLIKTTMRTLDDAIWRGKTCRVGASPIRAYQFVEAQYTADPLGLGRFVMM